MGSLASMEDHSGELKRFAKLRDEMVERNITTPRRARRTRSRCDAQGPARAFPAEEPP